MENVEAIYPVSPAQEAMLRHLEADGQPELYCEQLTCRLEGLTDSGAFVEAWRRTTDADPQLRAFFAGRRLRAPRQVVLKETATVEQEDLSGLGEAARRERLGELLRTERERVSDPYRPPLSRLVLCRTGAGAFQLIWSYQRLLLDRRSALLIFREALRAYAALREGVDPSTTKPRLTFGDYLTWLKRQDAQTAEPSAHEETNGSHATALPFVVRGSVEPAAESSRCARERVAVSAPDAVLALAREHGLSLDALLHGTWAFALSCYSGEERVCYGWSVAGRPPSLPGAESATGPLAHTIPLVVSVAPAAATVVSWLKEREAQLAQLRAFAVAGHDAAACVTTYGPPLFEGTSALDDEAADFAPPHAAGLKVCELRVLGGARAPLALRLLTRPEPALEAVYDAGRLDTAEARRVLNHLDTLLTAFAAEPGRPLARLSLLGATERRVLSEWNATEAVYPRACVQQMFEEQAAKTPHAPALVFEQRQLTYLELNRRANQLAHHLQALGVGPEVRVGLLLERSVELLVGLLAILKAGGAYVPLDPAYPPERLAFMLDDARAQVLLTQQRLADRLPATAAHVVMLDTDEEAVSRQSAENPATAAALDNLCYVIYTSGSTGWPKGIALAHRPLTNLIGWHFSVLSRGGRTLQFASMSFDASFHEIFATWCSGGTLFAVTEETRLDVDALGRAISRGSIAKVILPVVVLQQLAERDDAETDEPAALREVVTTGEQLHITTPVVEFFRRRPALTLHNHYGPSETHVVTSHTLGEAPGEWPSHPPIGRAIWNTQLHIVNRHLVPVPVGVAGELLIGGVSLARGYINRPALTAEKFIPDPFSDEPGARLYRTGDLARFMSDGAVEFIGRADEQVKVRGFRVEPGEIEAVLGQHPSVREVVVVVRADKADDKRLVAYVVPARLAAEAPAVEELQDFMRAKLPAYMMPSAFVFLAGFPLTVNGKVDRRALPPPDESRPDLRSRFVAPRTAAEEVVAGIWRDVLMKTELGVNDNFFALGGHSLLVTQVMARVRQTFQLEELPVRVLFEAPTVAGLVGKLAQAWESAEVVEEIARTWQQVNQLPADRVEELLREQPV